MARMEGITGHGRARSALALGVLALVLNLADVMLIVLSRESSANLVRLIGLLPTVAIWMLIAVRRPDNPLGWLMLAATVFFSVNTGASAYAILDYRIHHGTLPFGRLAIALEPAWGMSLVLLAAALWLFPDGHLPSGRGRRAGGILFSVGLLYGVLMFAAGVIAALGRTLRVEADGAPAVIDHPAGSWLIWAAIQSVGFFSLILSWVVWLAVQIPKYRTSGGERRLQLKWLYSGAAVFIVCLAVTIILPNDPSRQWRLVSLAAAPGLTALPVALGIAILKFRLYEIDRIISRTLSYAVVTGLVVGVYIGAVSLITHVLSFPGQVGVAASTLIAAVLFNPARKRVQRAVDRRFNRAHYDAEATVAAFAERLRESVDLPSMERELAAAVDQAFEPAHVTVWLARARQP